MITGAMAKSPKNKLVAQTTSKEISKSNTEKENVEANSLDAWLNLSKRCPQERSFLNGREDESINDVKIAIR